jgi:hypothetical protein
MINNNFDVTNVTSIKNKFSGVDSTLIKNNSIKNNAPNTGDIRKILESLKKGLLSDNQRILSEELYTPVISDDGAVIDKKFLNTKLQGKSAELLDKVNVLTNMVDTLLTYSASGQKNNVISNGVDHANATSIGSGYHNITAAIMAMLYEIIAMMQKAIGDTDLLKTKNKLASADWNLFLQNINTKINMQLAAINDELSSAEKNFWAGLSKAICDLGGAVIQLGITGWNHKGLTEKENKANQANLSKKQAGGDEFLDVGTRGVGLNVNGGTIDSFATSRGDIKSDMPTDPITLRNFDFKKNAKILNEINFNHRNIDATDLTPEQSVALKAYKTIKNNKDCFSKAAAELDKLNPALEYKDQNMRARDLLAQALNQIAGATGGTSSAFLSNDAATKKANAERMNAFAEAFGQQLSKISQGLQDSVRELLELYKSALQMIEEVLKSFLSALSTMHSR